MSQLFLWGVREIVYNGLLPHTKNLKRKDVFELQMDVEAKKARIKRMKTATVTIDGKSIG
jgi:hypothetical protein